MSFSEHSISPSHRPFAMKRRMTLATSEGVAVSDSRAEGIERAKATMQGSCVAWRSVLPLTATGMALLLASGCARVPVHQQRLVSKANMLFSASPVFDYYSSLLPQAESGASASGGAQAAGCTSCR